jgi:hypothetical protein
MGEPASKGSKSCLAGPQRVHKQPSILASFFFDVAEALELFEFLLVSPAGVEPATL